MSGSSSNARKPDDLKSRMLAHWYTTGLPLMVEALSEIIALEEILNQQRSEIERLDAENKQTMLEVQKLGDLHEQSEGLE